eukprot:766632-Hanusia_phi.AAC.3
MFPQVCALVGHMALGLPVCSGSNKNKHSNKSRHFLCVCHIATTGQPVLLVHPLQKENQTINFFRSGRLQHVLQASMPKTTSNQLLSISNFLHSANQDLAIIDASPVLPC